jgi:hypothetical protein
MAHDMSRRALLQLIPVAFATPVYAQPRVSPRPFKVSVPQAAIDRILRRVRETRLPDRLDAPDWRYGANWDYMKALAEYWTTKFDWLKLNPISTGSRSSWRAWATSISTSTTSKAEAGLPSR